MNENVEKEIFENVLLEMKKIFDNEIELVNKDISFNKRTVFQIEYCYKPHNYKLIIINEYTCFDVIIENENDEGNNFDIMYGLRYCYPNDLKQFLFMVKEKLEKNNFALYHSKGGEYYKVLNGIKYYFSNWEEYYKDISRQY